MKIIELEAQKRDISQKKAKVLRKEGFIPAVVYGHQTKTIPLQIKQGEFAKVYDQAGTSALVDLKIDETKPIKVLIHEPQIHPITSQPLHIDFYQVKMTEKIKTEIPVKIIGQSRAVEELDGNLITNKDSINIECLPNDLIPEIKVDISSLETFEDTIQVKNLKIPSVITVLEEPEDIVVSVTPPRSEEELEELEKEVEEAVEKVEVTEEKKPEEEEEVTGEAEKVSQEAEKKPEKPTEAATEKPTPPEKPTTE